MAEWNYRLRAKLDDDHNVTELTVEPDDELAKDWGDAWESEGRDEHGRFVGGGGGGSRTSGSGVPSARPGMGDVVPKQGDIAAMRQSSITGQHITADGQFTPERQALHDQIVQNLTSGAPKDQSDPKMIMMGGGPASGKSSALNSGKVSIDANSAVKVDPDVIKGMLPEVQDMKQAGDNSWAAQAHEESSYLAKRVVAAAQENQQHILLDGVNDGSADKIEAKIMAAQASGYKVEGHYVSVRVDNAIQREAARAEKTGRSVPQSVLRDNYSQLSTELPKVANSFDSLTMYDNNGASLKVMGETSGGSFNVTDSAAYKDFLNNAKG